MAVENWRSSLEIYDLRRGDLRVVLQTDRLIEAPNWHPDGWLMVNGDGRLWRVPLAAPELVPIDTGFCDRCNNDHGFLPDGRIVLTHHTGAGAAIYALGPDGPEPLVRDRPSWWHGATGTQITYAAARGGRGVRICRMDLTTGVEQILTADLCDRDGAEVHHDGPDYSACGQHIWFNCDLGGHAQIWRMRQDGSGAAQVFADAQVNWFPHPSPCGAHVLYLAYPPGTTGHPRDLSVALWLMDVQGGQRRKVVDLFGGQGSINVPCWAPDGHAFAFMRYAPA